MGTASVSRLQEQQLALDRILGSQTFARTPRLSALLAYLCKQSFDGLDRSLKEYDIATDVFNRPTDFDQTTDAIVRVEMHRLRKKLKDYYALEGANEVLAVSLQTGKYMPEFVDRIFAVEALPSASLVPLSNEQGRQLEPARQIWPGRLPAPKRRISQWGWLGISLLFAVAIAAVLIWFIHRPAIAASSLPAAAGIVHGSEIRILCGSSETGVRDRQGNDWTPDAFFSGGSAVSLPSQPIYRTRDASLFQSARVGEFSYKIPLKPGVYELRLYFADTTYHPGTSMEGGEGNRMFMMKLNGALALRDFDIIADAGPDTADVKVFKDVRPEADGFLHLSFSTLVGTPILNSIEILPSVPHAIQPIRITTQNRVFVDRAGVTWQPDNYFLQGKVVSRFGSVSGPHDPELYECERYGNFSYAIPVPAGRYRVTLHFAETYWGPGLPGGGGIGSRVFNVFCNGQTLLRDFDMFAEAGPDKEITKTFHGLQPNGQGTLLLSFVPVKNYANISAIEVVDESE